MEKGRLSLGEAASASIDVINRNLVRANHTATHLLNAALRRVLGPHVKQAGSLVAPDRFRFDFTHFNAITAEEIGRIESIVNEKIWENLPVTTEVMKYDDALKTGATAVFDEKYEDVVRVVSVADFSSELCGGTHAAGTGQIGLFKIVREASPGAGMRRIEAVTLKGVLDRYNAHDEIISRLEMITNAGESAMVKRIEDIIKRARTLEKEVDKLKKSTLAADLDSIMSGASEVRGTRIISHIFNGLGAEELRGLSDSVRSKDRNAVVLFGSDNADTALLLFAASKGAAAKGIDCGAIIMEAAKHIGGGGGGRKDMAQAGGKSPAGLAKAIDHAVNLAKNMIEK
jgi:alanyl-tRNA synthetase